MDNRFIMRRRVLSVFPFLSRNNNIPNTLCCSFCPLSTFVYTNGDKCRCSGIFWLNQVDLDIMDVFQLMFEGSEMFFCI